MHVNKAYGPNSGRIDGATDVVSRRWLGFAASDGLLRTRACLPCAASLRMRSKQASG